MLKQLLLLTLIVSTLSCKNKERNTYAIKDFRNSLQPFLIRLVSIGLVKYNDSSQIKSFTDDELIRLGKSENPVLRATAFHEILKRSTFNHFDIVMNHLDDTAIVAIDLGEFGIAVRTVSDNILQNATWETLQAKNKTIEQVLIKHNYLRSAYRILLKLEPQQKYYTYIKDMATRPRRFALDDAYELGVNEIEYALYGLAKFRKKEDVQLINNKLMEFNWGVSDVSFRLMKEFPDSAYLDVLQTYHRRQFYKFSSKRPYRFLGINADRVFPENFIQALVIQQNEKSAKLLDTMLTYLPKYTCMPDKENIIDEVITAIWEHPCPAYTQLRKKIRRKAEEIVKGQISIPMDTDSSPVDTTRRKFYWYD